MDENKTYKQVGPFSKEPTSFGKSILIPFFSGILGTILVIGICFSVPSVRNYLFAQISTESTLTSSNLTNTPSSNPNTDLISLLEYSDTAISVADKVLPSVVGIKVEYKVNSVFQTQGAAQAEGSGIIISENGYILTNNHIVNSSSTSSFYTVSEASKVEVFLYGDDTPIEATIVGTDELTDLAVIKIEKEGLTAAELGSSADVKIGEFVMAIGNPLGMQNSVSAGIVSALNREITDSDGKKYTLLQTDAAINSGNSGGALVNSKGQVIGINTMKFSGTGVEGMGFAIPIDNTRDISSQLIQYSKVLRPYIGISGVDLDEQLAQRNNLPVGIYVKTVEDFSSAQKADVRIGDVIIKANNTAVKTMNELNEIKNGLQIGDKITLTLVRDGEEKSITLTLSEQP